MAPPEDKENAEPVAQEKPKEKPKEELGVPMIVASPDDDAIQLRMKGEETSPLNGASVDNRDEVLVLETITSVFGTEFSLVKAGRKKGYMRAAYLAAACGFPF